MPSSELRISGVNYESFVDGQGVRAAIFFSGCPHHCPGCHNPQTHDPSSGVPAYLLLDQIVEEIAKRPFLQGITLTGGDPFYDPFQTSCFLASLAAHLARARWSTVERPKDIWIYSGYTWESLLALTNPFADRLLRYCDVLVDGPFIQDLADKTLLFRGSSNQRVIQIHPSLEKGEPVLWTSVQ